MRQKNGNVLISIAAFFIIFFVFCAFAVDFSLMLSARSQLQKAVETAALKSITSTPTPPELVAEKVFSYYKIGQIKEASIISVNYLPIAPSTITIEAHAPVPTYFLSALGVATIDIQAKAKAKIVNQDVDVAQAFDGIKLSNILFDKDLDEIFVDEAEPANGYYVFVGLSDGTNPPKWVNISCTATPIAAGSFVDDGSGAGGYYKGSAKFDVGKKCDEGYYQGNANIATHLRIIPVQTTINSVKILNIAKLVAN